jgi:hypothetical protein
MLTIDRSEHCLPFTWPCRPDRTGPHSRSWCPDLLSRHADCHSSRPLSRRTSRSGVAGDRVPSTRRPSIWACRFFRGENIAAARLATPRPRARRFLNPAAFFRMHPAAGSSATTATPLTKNLRSGAPRSSSALRLPLRAVLTFRRSFIDSAFKFVLSCESLTRSASPLFEAD